jgi:hypothetical protein
LGRESQTLTGGRNLVDRGVAGNIKGRTGVEAREQRRLRVDELSIIKCLL